MTNYGVILAIMDMASAKSDVKCPKKKVCFWRILMKKVKIRIDPNCIELNLSINQF